MSLKSTAFLRQTLTVGVLTVIMPVTYAQSINSFDDALDKVQRYQAQNEIRQQRQAISGLNVQQSKLWQNPSISISQDGFGSTQDRELNVGISQPLDLFGQRKINQKIAQTQDQQVELQQQLWMAKSRLIVEYVWSKMSLAEVEKALYTAQLKVSQSNLDSAQKRYQAGSIALVDYERAQIEALNIQRLYQQALLNHQVTQRQLSNLWGESSADIQFSTLSLPWPNQSDDTVKRYIVEGWLEKLYQLNIQQSQQQIERLKIQSRPNPTLNLGVKRSQTANENNETALVMGVNVPLNIFNRQQYSIPISERQQSLVNKQQQRELKQQILDIANSMLQLKNLRTQFDASSDQIRLAEQVQMRTLQGFQAGKLSMTDVQQASAQLQSIRLGQLEILNQAWQTALTAEALSLGTSYEDISRSDAYTALNKAAIAESQMFINEGAQ